MNNIDLSKICSEEEGDSWTPIGNSEENAYTGTFNGNGKTIENLYINNTTSEEDQGLFGNVSSGGKIEKLVVSGSVTDTSSNSNDVGGIVGQNFGGTVTGCAFSGTVTSSGISGGVVGDNGGSVTNSYNTGTVTGPVSASGNNSVRVGGVVGSNSLSATVTNCYNTGTVTGPVSASRQ